MTQAVSVTPQVGAQNPQPTMPVVTAEGLPFSKGERQKSPGQCRHHCYPGALRSPSSDPLLSVFQHPHEGGRLSEGQVADSMASHKETALSRFKWTPYPAESQGSCLEGLQYRFSFSGDEQPVCPPRGLLWEHLPRAQTLLGERDWQTDLLPPVRGAPPGKERTEEVCSRVSV